MAERDYSLDPDEEQRLQQRGMSEQFGMTAERDPQPRPQTTEPASTTMPVGGDPRSQSDVDQEFMRGTQAGQDMSWMQTPGAVTAGGGQAFAPQTFQGFTPRHAMEGFDFRREQNTGKSAKDAFAYLANQAPPPPLNDKAALGAWFQQYIAPGMNALGHQVQSVDGDKFRFNNWQGTFDVDYGRGAGADNGALAWQVDPGTAQMPENATYTPQGLTMLDVLNPGADDATARVMAEIDALIKGTPTPMQQQALAQLFGA